MATSQLVAGLYSNMGEFPIFQSLSLLYFAAASFAETVRRLGKPELAKSFLLYDHPQFGPECEAIFKLASGARTPHETKELHERILRAINPIDVAGLSRRDRNGWYPVDAEDLYRAAWKVGASRDQISAMLERCGFHRQPVPSGAG